jgi:hypothetical protein
MSMTDRATKTHPGQSADPAPPTEVYCRRVERPLAVEEHVDCPYCYGKKNDVQTTEHRQFCDFEPGKDPIHFGFPDTYGA